MSTRACMRFAQISRITSEFNNSFATGAMTSTDHLRFTVFNAGGLKVRGNHSPAGLPVLESLQADHAAAHQAWLTRVLTRPGGFDGHRAVLINAQPSDASLHPESVELTTGYRSYTEGRALHDVLATARTNGLELTNRQFLVPDLELAWGFSLSTTILLPCDHVLCAQRSTKLLVSPGQWLPNFTEVIEPSDMDSVDMAPLCERLIAEEVPLFQSAGPHRFVGLGVRKDSYDWQLVSVLDARQAVDSVLKVLAQLEPDAETEQWGIAPLTPAAAIAGKLFYPESIVRPAAIDLALPQFLLENIPHAFN